MQFSICVLEPEGSKYTHFLYDICRYFCYGIESAGYECCILRNKLSSDRVNIIVGAHNQTDPAVLEQIKNAGEYILLQSEIITGDTINNWPVQKSFAEVYLPLMQQASAVWTGVKTNIGSLKKLGVEADLVRGMGYHPLMEEIHHKHHKDIDFLFYGSITPHRKNLLDALMARGSTVVTMFDDAAMYRNDLIARTRVHVAPNQGPGINQNLGTRMIYLINNRSIIVVEHCHDQEMYEHCFPWANTEHWVDLCMDTLHRPDLAQITEEYYENFKKIKMVDFIEPLLEKFFAKDKSPSPVATYIKSDHSLETNNTAKVNPPLNPQFKHNDAVSGLTSIIIPIQSIHLYECVTSIKQYTKEPHEIIFLDHGAAPKLKKQLAKASKEDSNYKVIKIDKGTDFTQSLNVGIKESTGEYIVLLFDDVFVGEGWLSDMLEFLNGGNKIGIVGPMSDRASSLQRVEGIDFKSLAERSSFRERNRHRRILTRSLDGFCLLFKRDLLIQIGLFDEILGQDKHVFDDFCLRAVLEGYNNVIAGNVTVQNRGGIDRLLSRNITLLEDKWSGLDASTPLAERALTANAIEQARLRYQRGDVEDAVKTLIERIGFAPNERGLVYRMAGILLAENRFQDALDALQWIPAAEDDAEYHALLGYGNEGLGLCQAAEEHADRALAIDENSAVALNLRGILSYRKDDLDKAEEFFRQAIEADPGYGDPYTNMGMLRWKGERQEEALDLFEKGFILLPDNGDLITAYFTAVSSLERYGRAEKIFREAQTAYPENKRLLFLLIDILLKQEKFQEAMCSVEKAIVDFGIDEGILAAALEIRKKIGAKSITLREGAAKTEPTLSVCMIVKDEERHLAKCLYSVSPVADEMIVVDTGSQDKTLEIAESFGAQVYNFAWTNDFSAARNYSLSKAQGDWILVMDADEVLSFQDHAKLKKLLVRKEKPAYLLWTRNYVTGTTGDGWTCNDNQYIDEQKGRGWFPSLKVRLFPNIEQIRFEQPVHELVEYSLRRIGFKQQVCNIPVHHYGEFDVDRGSAKDRLYYDLGMQKLNESGGDYKSVRELAIQVGELGKHEESIELWLKVLAFNPQEAIAYTNLANHYHRLEKYEDFHACVNKAYALDPLDQATVLNYGISELLVGDINKSISVVEGFLKGNHSYVAHVALLAVCFLIIGEKERGVQYLRDLVKKNYDFMRYIDLSVHELITSGNLIRAKSLLTAAIEIDFYDEEILALQAKCEEIDGNHANHSAVSATETAPSKGE